MGYKEYGTVLVLARHFQIAIDNLSSLAFETYHAELPEALPHQVRIVIMQSAVLMVRTVPALVYYNAAPNAIEDIPIVAVSLV